MGHLGRLDTTAPIHDYEKINDVVASGIARISDAQAHVTRRLLYLFCNLKHSLSATQLYTVTEEEGYIR